MYCCSGLLFVYRHGVCNNTILNPTTLIRSVKHLRYSLVLQCNNYAATPPNVDKIVSTTCMPTSITVIVKLMGTTDPRVDPWVVTGCLPENHTHSTELDMSGMQYCLILRKLHFCSWEQISTSIYMLALRALFVCTPSHNPLNQVFCSVNSAQAGWSHWRMHRNKISEDVHMQVLDAYR